MKQYVPNQIGLVALRLRPFGKSFLHGGPLFDAEESSTQRGAFLERAYGSP